MRSTLTPRLLHRTWQRLTQGHRAALHPTSQPVSHARDRRPEPHIRILP